MKAFSTSILWLCAWLLAGTAFAQGSTALRIEQAWARPTVTGQSIGGGYVSITNTGRVADRLVGGSTPAARRVELHAMTMEGDVMRMRQIDAIDLPPGRQVKLEPGGLHLMLIDLTAPLKTGASVPLTLRFEKAGEVPVQLSVRQPHPAAASHKH